jgi:hypothetical protein
MVEMTTTLQQAMIVKIAEDYLNKSDGSPESAEGTEAWADMIIENAKDKGVFVSLLNAGFVWHVGVGRDAGCGLTDSGFEEYKRIKGGCDGV